MKLQLLQPIAGVRPTPLSSAFATGAVCMTAATTIGAAASPAAIHRINLVMPSSRARPALPLATDPLRSFSYAYHQI
jgi:hypothetical protein